MTFQEKKHFLGKEGPVGAYEPDDNTVWIRIEIG